jgi:hypothetical protein
MATSAHGSMFAMPRRIEPPEAISALAAGEGSDYVSASKVTDRFKCLARL